MATNSEPHENLPLERTQESMPSVLTGGKDDWKLFDDDGNPLHD